MEPDQKVVDKEKERLILFDFDENDCDVIIKTTDEKEIHIPSNFMNRVSDNSLDDKTIHVDASSEKIIQALSFYYPKCWKQPYCKS